MKILFISATNLGDAVLTTGALDYLTRTYPSADITVACGPIVTGIFSAAPGVSRVISMKKEPYAGHWRKLAAATLLQKWDIVADMRNSPLSRILLANKRYIWSTHSKTRHKVEQVGDTLGLTMPPAPKLWLDAASTKAAHDLIGDDPRPVLALGPAARWPGKAWLPENYAALALRLIAEDGAMAGARVAVFAAPGEEAAAAPVLAAIPENQRIDAIAKTTPLAAAAAIARCALYIGNDSGLTHAAAATGIKTLALFGPGYPALYRPWGAHAAYVSTPETAAELTGYTGYHPKAVKGSLMSSLTVTAAYDAAVELLQSR